MYYSSITAGFTLKDSIITYHPERKFTCENKCRNSRIIVIDFDMVLIIDGAERELLIINVAR